MRHALVALCLLLPSLALAGGPKALQGSWQVHISAEEQVQIDAMTKHAQDTPEDGMAKAMLKAVLAAAEAKLTIDATTLTFAVMGEIVPAKYSATPTDGGWSLKYANDKGEEKTLIASVSADGILNLTDASGKVSTFDRLK